MRNGIAIVGAWVCTMAFCMMVDYSLVNKFGAKAKHLDDARIDKFF